MPISKGAQGVTGLESKKLVSDDRMEAAAASAESEEDDEEDEDGLSDVDEVSGWIIRLAADIIGGASFSPLTQPFALGFLVIQLSNKVTGLAEMCTSWNFDFLKFLQ